MSRLSMRAGGVRGAVSSVALLGMLATLACQTNTGTGLDRKSTQGAILGGLAGAALGRAVGGHKHAGAGIAIGALSGAMAGGLLGNYMDKQQQELDAIADANVERTQDRLIVTFAGDLLFDPGSSNLSPGAQDRLRQLADTLNRYPQSRVVVKGYTDAQGAESYNLDLSDRRARNVANYLIGQRVSPSRITALGFGEQSPLASNATAVGRQQNRRVEIEIVPIEEQLREQGSTGGRY